MVAVEDVRASNAQITTSLPPGLVAVFAGGTAGLGETAVKQFAQRARRPRIYLVGRSEDDANRIIAECQAAQSDATFVFLQKDLSLLRNVDALSAELRARETHLNLLVMSYGVADFSRTKTDEGLHRLVALVHYSRLRLATNLLPLLTAPGPAAGALRRVVDVAGGTMEGELVPSDMQALDVPLKAFRGHLCMLVTLGIEAVASSSASASDGQAGGGAVSFVHLYPGNVRTKLWERVEGWTGTFMRNVMRVMAWFDPNVLSFEEAGERLTWAATAERFAPRRKRGESVEGQPKGFAVYLADAFGDGPKEETQRRLERHREEGMVERVWEDVQSHFERIRGATS